MSKRVELTALHPQLSGEDAGKWTDRILSHRAEHGTNRQCSIGYHGECSDRAGESCRCLCHDDAARYYTVEGHPDSGGHIITRVEQGRHTWPPVEGEPAGTWAHWVMGYSEDDAKDRAIGKQSVLDAAKPVPVVEPEERIGITLTRDQLEAWAGRALTDEEVEDLDRDIPNSSIPEAISTIVDFWTPRT